jgi:hypothetical protein
MVTRTSKPSSTAAEGMRIYRRQDVSADMRSAAIEFRSERFLRVNWRAPAEYHDQIAGLYRCGDGSW